MLNFRLLGNIILIALLALLQGLIFNRITFEQAATPYIYVLFILLYSVKNNRYLFLLLSFLLGWGVDLLSDTGGIHAFASLTTAYLCLPVIRMIHSSRTFEKDEFRYAEFSVGQWFVYTLTLVLCHHFLLFFFESFSFSNMKDVLLRTLYCAAFTLIFVYFYLIVFRKRERQ